MFLYSGSFVQVGAGAPNVTVPMWLIASKELSFYGSFRYAVSATSLLS